MNESDESFRVQHQDLVLWVPWANLFARALTFDLRGKRSLPVPPVPAVSMEPFPVWYRDLQVSPIDAWCERSLTVAAP